MKHLRKQGLLSFATCRLGTFPSVHLVWTALSTLSELTQCELPDVVVARGRDESSDIVSLKLFYPQHAFVFMSFSLLCFIHGRTGQQQSHLFLSCLVQMERRACLRHSPGSYLNGPSESSLPVFNSFMFRHKQPRWPLCGQSSLPLPDDCPPNQANGVLTSTKCASRTESQVLGLAAKTTPRSQETMSPGREWGIYGFEHCPTVPSRLGSQCKWLWLHLFTPSVDGGN